MYNILKRSLDLVLSTVGIVLYMPLFIVISICIKMTSKGPILFSQARLGKDAVPFEYYKFRTMYADSDCRNDKEFVKNLIDGKYGEIGKNTVFKIKNDTRITPIGRFLRKTSLDELPQFFNVLKGEMSLVGPRPPIPYEYERYDEWHKERLKVKPGITGLWQIYGRSSTTFDEMVRIDIEYSREKSILLDLKILMMTPLVVLRGKGAY